MVLGFLLATDMPVPAVTGLCVILLDGNSTYLCDHFRCFVLKWMVVINRMRFTNLYSTPIESPCDFVMKKIVTIVRFRSLTTFRKEWTLINPLLFSFHNLESQSLVCTSARVMEWSSVTWNSAHHSSCPGKRSAFGLHSKFTGFFIIFSDFDFLSSGAVC